MNDNQDKRPRRRRGRGEGGLFQRADGTWAASISLGYDGNGRRRRRTVYGATKKEAQDELRKIQDEAGRGVIGPAARLTVTDYLDRWLRIVKPTVEPNTYNPYERHCRLYLKPHIGHLRLSELKALHVTELYAAMLADGVSAALTRKVGTTLTVALGEAMRQGQADYNAARGVRKPKAQRPEMKVWDLDQVATFLKHAASDRLYAMYVTALDTGMRPGELFALEWVDIDFNAGHVSVMKSLEEIAGHLRIKDVKTRKGRRRIDLTPEALAALHEHRKAMLAEGHAAGPVFCNTLGTYLRISDVRLASFKSIIERANKTAAEESDKTQQSPSLLPDLRLYDLRHTSATLLLLADVPAKVVSERLGHSTINLTLDTYSHVLPTMQKNASQKMSRILGHVIKAKLPG